SKPWSKPSLGSLIRKHFHNFRNHLLVALVTEPAEAPLVVATQGMLQHVQKAFITVRARRVFGSGPSFLQQHRQVRVGKEGPRDGACVARALLQDSKNAVSGLKSSRANDRNADVLLDLSGGGCVDTLDHLWDCVPLPIKEMLCASPAKPHQPAQPRVSHE